MRTELVWEGKYDEFGNRREVDVAACAMPMQKIETVDEPRQRAAAEGQTDMFEQKLMQVRETSPVWPDFRNRLIWGDNKLVLASLLKEFKGKVDLIYIDPPFDVGADFTAKVPVGDATDTVFKDQSTLEIVAYKDTWGKGTDSYLHMMAERLTIMRDLLSEGGTIYIHSDWHMNFLLRSVMEDVFGHENFVNELVWYYCNKMHDIRKPIFPRSHDTILVYSKSRSSERVFNQLKEKRDKPVQQLVRKKVDGRMVNARDENGNILYKASTMRNIDDVWRISMLQPADKSQNTGYATQKNDLILRRIIEASSNPGDLVADFFCGSGTTGAVAEKLGRRWIMADLGRFAIHTTRKRMIEVQRELHAAGKPYRAFDVYNLGRYERQWWQQERLQGADAEHRRVVLEFFKDRSLKTVSDAGFEYPRKGKYTACIKVVDTFGCDTSASVMVEV